MVALSCIWLLLLYFLYVPSPNGGEASGVYVVIHLPLLLHF